MATTRSRKAARNTTPVSAAEGAGVSPAPGAEAAVDPAAESAREEQLAIAESLTPPGGSVDEILGGAVVAGSVEEFDGAITHLRVRALRDGFRRCGRAWSAHEVEVAADAFTEAEVERLLAEPNLVVVPVCGPARPIE